MHFMKNLTLASLVVVSLVALSGCNGEVVVAPAQHCVDQPVEVCHDYRDWRGFWHHECRTEIHQHCWLNAEALGAPIGPVGVGNDFNVSYDAADKLIQVAASANKGNVAPAVQTGLGAADIMNLSKQQLPTDAGIEAVAKNLDQDTSAIRGLFAGILEETKANKAAGSSK
jgi:copper oxidase (laccase) domain-containing protein